MQKLSVIILSLFVLLIACSKEESSVNEPQEKEMAYAELSLSYGTRAAIEGPGTSGVGNENKVSQMVVYIFNDDGTPDGTNARLVIPQWEDGKTYTISVEAGDKIFCAVANGGTPAADGAMLDEVRELMVEHSLNNTNSRVIPSEGIPMGGESAVTVTAGEHNVPVTIDIHRTFSKLQPLEVDDNIEVTLSSEDLEKVFDNTATNTNLVKFDLEAYYVINGITKSYLLPKYNRTNEQNDWVDWNLGVLANYFSSDYTNKEPEKVYSGDGSAAWIQKGETTDVYVYENSPVGATTSLGVPGFHKKSVCALILRGTLTYNNDPQKEVTRYWRLNLAYDYNYKIFRNVQYTVTLEKITSIGYETAEEAEEDKNIGEVVPPKGGTSVSATIKIQNWRNIGLGQGV